LSLIIIAIMVERFFLRLLLERFQFMGETPIFWQ
jgi:hypothetical protein